MSKFIKLFKDEKDIHMRNSESLDKIVDILSEELKRDDISKEDRNNIYNIISKIAGIHRESQIQNTKHITSRGITTIGVMGATMISLGTILIHERYKTKRTR